MSSIIENWADELKEEVLNELVAGKTIYVWGAYSTGHKVYSKLESFGYRMGGYIDAHKNVEKYMEVKVYKPEDILCLEDIFVFIAIEGVRKDIIRYLNSHLLTENVDYYYISNNIPNIVVASVNGYYKDAFGNTIISKGTINVKICLSGYNNRIVIGQDCVFSDKTGIFLENGGYVEIGNSVISAGKVAFEALDGGTLKIGNNTSFNEGAIISSRKTSIVIGDYVSSGNNLLMISAGDSPIEIGSDCMISHDVSILSSSAHSIIDLEKRENRSIISEKHVIIGNHVWLGKNVIVLYNSEIGSGSIVGAGSVVKTSCGENCILAGNLARVISNNKTWDRRRYINFEEL